jgi:hypothetical protein
VEDVCEEKRAAVKHGAERLEMEVENDLGTSSAAGGQNKKQKKDMNPKNGTVSVPIEVCRDNLVGRSTVGGSGPRQRLVIRDRFLQDKPIESTKSWTRSFKKQLDAVLTSKVFPYLKFVNETHHLADVGYMGYIFEQLGYGGKSTEDSDFRKKNWMCIAEYTQRKITSHRNNVVTDCKRMIKGKDVCTCKCCQRFSFAHMSSFVIVMVQICCVINR